MTTTYLTTDDVQTYGSELVDFAQRAAAHAVSPQLQELKAQNAALRQRLARESRQNLDDRVARAVPNYKQIDQDPRWHSWLVGTDAFTGRMRQQLLNDAVRNRDNARVTAIFNGFLQQHGASSQAQAPAARQARSTYGAGRVYSRDDIKALYEQHRKGAWAGREAEWSRVEQDIIAASREGRIRGAVDLAGK